MATDPWAVVSTVPAQAASQVPDPWSVVKTEPDKQGSGVVMPDGIPMAPSTFPSDDPAYRYGNILPLAQDKATGRISLAVPEIIRSPLRGVLSIGSKLTGDKPIDPNATLTPDEFGALGLVPMGEPITAAAGRAADALAPQAVGDVVPKVTAQQLGALKLSSKAAQVVEKRLNQDVGAGGTSAQDVLNNLNKARSLGKPYALLDAGPNVRGLAGSVSRTPGEAKTTIKNMLEQRDTSAADRLKQDIQRNLSGGDSAYQTTRTLIGARQAEAQPLYDRAFAGGSIAPLRQQFEDAFSQASSQETKAAQDLRDARNTLTMVSGTHLPTDNVYAASARNTKIRMAQASVDAAERGLQQAQATKQQVLQTLQQSQADVASNAPGAVWNPRIQQFLDDPVMKRGMARGMEIQRLEDLAAGRPFDPTELAMSPEGEVIKVPNMRTLDAGKKGLDAIIESEGRDEFGRLNQYGRAVNQVRVSLLSELDRVNPDYAAARSAWSGRSASLDAVKFGRNLTRMNPDQISEEFGAMSPNDKEFARLGAADALMERLAKTGFGGDEAKAIVKNEWSKGQLKPLFRSEADFQKFIDSVGVERGMFENKRGILGGSQTAERGAEDDSNKQIGTALDAIHGVSSFMAGNPISALRSGLRVYQDLGLRQNPDLNSEIARILTDLDITPTVENGRVKIPTKTLRDVVNKP